MKCVCSLNFPVESIKSQEIEVLPSSVDTDLKSSNLLQDKNKSEKSKTGKQAKKAKVETESRNIKDMFSRASRRGS
ncbi:hypothetical protein Patl1_05291 [Pistacia atlantica]|uniref:Uncharacterized protein n=1 Tax=Pistacia atlantica TaxID=434234 RepID=A0ACC1BTZ6_9ROSI|nr:hypothetical protein Patl1_05291 [Pistacia atlantica]